MPDYKQHLTLKGYKVGDWVTLDSNYIPVFAYYSGYGNNPICLFEAGDFGVLKDINIPSVKYDKYGSDTMNIIDFYKYGRVWRVALRAYQVQRYDIQ